MVEHLGNLSVIIEVQAESDEEASKKLQQAVDDAIRAMEANAKVLSHDLVTVEC